MRLGKVRDLVRGGIIHETMGGLCRVLDYFHKSDAVTVVRIKNRFETPSDAGWTDCMLNFYFRDDPHRHVCEVQLIHHKMFSQRTVQDGHDGYNIFRSSYELLAYHENLPGQRKMSTVRSASVRRALKKENHDGDDFISSKEAYRIQLDLGLQKTRDEVDDMLLDMDKNGDGKVTTAEFLTFIKAMKKKTGKAHRSKVIPLPAEEAKEEEPHIVIPNESSESETQLSDVAEPELAPAPEVKSTDPAAVKPRRIRRRTRRSRTRVRKRKPIQTTAADIVTV